MANKVILPDLDVLHLDVKSVSDDELKEYAKKIHPYRVWTPYEDVFRGNGRAGVTLPDGTFKMWDSFAEFKKWASEQKESVVILEQVTVEEGGWRGDIKKDLDDTDKLFVSKLSSSSSFARGEALAWIWFPGIGNVFSANLRDLATILKMFNVHPADWDRVYMEIHPHPKDTGAYEAMDSTMNYHRGKVTWHLVPHQNASAAATAAAPAKNK